MIPWSLNKEHRMNPRNGLCLNTMHDSAFDKGLITITTDYTLKISGAIYEHKENISITSLFLKQDKRKITVPDKFIPDKDFLVYHNEVIYRG